MRQAHSTARPWQVWRRPAGISWQQGLAAVRHWGLWRHPAWVPFLLSRALIMVTAIAILPLVKSPNATTIPLPRVQDWHLYLRSVLLFADSGWYMSILRDGYAPGPFSAAVAQNWGFFPGFPVLVKGLGVILPFPPEWLGILLSNVALLLAMVVLQDVVSTEWNESAGETAVWLLAFFPTSYFLSGFRPEALFLLLTLVAYQEARQGHWWTAGLAGGLASLSRLQGLLVGVFLVYIAVREYQSVPPYRRNWRLLAPPVGALALTAAGGALVMLALGLRTGNPLAYNDILFAVWGHQLVWPWTALAGYISQPYIISAGGWDLGATNFLLVVVGLVTAAGLLVQRRFAMGLYAAVTMLVVLSTFPALSGSGRYMATLFPIYSFVAVIYSGRSGKWPTAILAVSAGLLALLCILVELGVYAAQA